MRILQRSIYTALALTAALIIGFLHLDAQLSAGAFDNLNGEGAFVLALAFGSAATWAFAYWTYRQELNRRLRRRRRMSAFHTASYLKAA